jgi:hypothetical protein
MTLPLALWNIVKGESVPGRLGETWPVRPAGGSRKGMDGHEETFKPPYV